MASLVPSAAMEVSCYKNLTISGDFRGKSVLSMAQFTHRSDVECVLNVAQRLQSGQLSASDIGLNGRLMAVAFYEPSTRTSASFQAAALKLGMLILPLGDMAAASSAVKGETLEDTMLCLQSYADIIVLRHPESGAALRAANVLDVPLLNAGDGAGEHPTQALLDLLTIQTERGTIDGLTITMLGDLKHGRTVHSLSRALKHFKVRINYVSPNFLRCPDEIVDEMRTAGIEVHVTENLDVVLQHTDILYVTRVQKERFVDMQEYQKAANAYRITPEMLAACSPNLRVLHPLPRVNEIDTRCDKDPRAAYIRQMKCGLFVRMALLALVLGGKVDGT